MRITSWAAFSFVVVLCGGPLWSACGGSGGAGDVGASDGGEDRSAAVGADGASGVDASGAGGGSDASAAPDGPVGPPAEGGTGAPTLRCGYTATCSLPGQICCVALAQQYTCVTATTCPVVVGPNPAAPGSAALKCSGQESCAAGLSCCLDIVDGQAVSSCQPSCAAAHAQLCAPFTPGPGCPGGALNCSQSHINEFGLSVAYGTCGGVKN